MLTIWEKIQAAHLTGLIPQTLVAVERESHRIDDHGVLAVTDHPKALGNRATHPYFQTDFAESQLEIITSPNVLAQTVDELQALTASALRGLPQTEALWPLTMPATLPHDVPIAHPTPERLAYREQLVAKTKAVNPQLMSSIHLNLSLPEQLFERLYEAEDFKGTPPSYLDYRNQIYLHLAQQWIKYRFVLTYLLVLVLRQTPISTRHCPNSRCDPCTAVTSSVTTMMSTCMSATAVSRPMPEI
ncbi:hypothetical protein [Lacticaseibacillus saniviri]|uniref:hypothetical protein n=1 Tax=Lacticaseibacillus saniviri TaxID=931533 RepID=UPI0006D090B5|nr:hypothetical protein [Lacticaseibacillus saniviri]